jgi:uncharacterized protein YdhG (YjbR/CyaY superfamily)
MATTKIATKRSAKVWSDEERAAMREGARERRSAAKLSPGEERAAGEAEVRAKLAAMPEPDRHMGERIHELVLAAAPALVPKTYYGMPAYALNGRPVCFFKPKSKFKMKYSTFEFQVDAGLDDGDMWPIGFALKELSPAAEARISELVKKAVG